MTRVPHARVLPSGDLELRFPYEPAFIEALKAEIPAYAREYDPATKQWRVDAAYSGGAIHLFRTFFPAGRIEERKRAPQAKPPQNELATTYATLHLLPDAPSELVTAAYKCLAKLHHPDCGGDTERMRALNDAFQQIGGA